MSDLMTFTINDADLDKLNEILKDINVKECPWFEIQDKYGVKAKYYREPRWIPCSERLPEEDDVEVLCTVKQQNKTDYSEIIIVEQGCYFYGTWLLSYDNQRVNCSREVLAWMPLPEPY